MKFGYKEIGDGFLAELSYSVQKTTKNELRKVTDKVTDNLPENQMQILRMIRKNAFFTTKELADKIKISQQNKREYGQIKKERTHQANRPPPKGGHWEIIKEKTK